jgi:hypothetical protein
MNYCGDIKEQRHIERERERERERWGFLPGLEEPKRKEEEMEL